MYQQYLLREEDVEPLGDAVVRTLAEVGIICQNDELLRCLADAGARVDPARQTATFPAEVTRRLVEQVRAEYAPGARPARPFGRLGLPTISLQIAQHVYDWGRQERRAGNRQDFVDLVKFGDSLHGEDGVGHCLLLGDVPPLLEPLEAALLLAEHARRPQPAFVWNVAQIDYLKEMGEIIGRADWYCWGAICIAHPLRFDKDVADKYLRRVREGHATGLTAMPVAGMSTPLTTAGFVTVAAAEVVAGWLLTRAIDPTVGIAGSMWAGAVDMRTGEVSYSSFDAMAYGFAVSEFLLRWTNVFVPVGGGEYCDARYPGYFAAYEKAYKAMSLAAFNGQHPGLGQGMLEDGKTICAAQLLLERELTTGVNMYSRPVVVDEQTLALDDIVRIGHGLTANHFQTDRTLLGFRDWSWCPQVLDRAGWRGPETDRAVLDRYHQQYLELVAGHRPPEVTPGQLQAMRRVVERARRELLA